MKWLVSPIVMLVLASPTFSQSFSSESTERAMQKLKQREEIRKKNHSHPSSQPADSGRSQKQVAITPPRRLVLDPNAPKLIKDWFARLPLYRQQQITLLYTDISEIEDQARAQADQERDLVKATQMQAVGTTQIRNSLGGYSTIDDPAGVARKAAAVQYHRDKMYNLRRLIRVTDKSIEYLKQNKANYLPILKKWLDDHLPPYTVIYDAEQAIYNISNDPTFIYIPHIEHFAVGEVGYLPSSMKVAQVVDGDSGMVMVGDTRLWLSGMDFSTTTDDQYISYDKPVIVIGTKTYKNVMGSTTTCLEVIPFPVFDYIKIVEDKTGV